ncbi:MAG TPA: hypothetical protein VHB98_06300 [Chloroflexota bacterium]|nr:hypothetical protein [Chloroflexota bacterium]
MAWIVKPCAAHETVLFQWTPDRTIYWIAFGSFAPGKRVSPEQRSTATAVLFPPGVYAMTATLHPDGTWTVAPTPTA